MNKIYQLGERYSPIRTFTVQLQGVPHRVFHDLDLETDIVHARIAPWNAVDRSPAGFEAVLYYTADCNVVGPKGDYIGKMHMCRDGTENWYIQERPEHGGAMVPCTDRAARYEELLAAEVSYTKFYLQNRYGAPTTPKCAQC